MELLVVVYDFDLVAGGFEVGAERQRSGMHPRHLKQANQRDKSLADRLSSRGHLALSIRSWLSIGGQILNCFALLAQGRFDASDSISGLADILNEAKGCSDSQASLLLDSVGELAAVSSQEILLIGDLFLIGHNSVRSSRDDRESNVAAGCKMASRQ